MNIFVLHDNPVVAARYLCDKHVVKMTLETAQILSTVWHQYNEEIPEPHYRSTHENHPCVKWAGMTKDNYQWLVAHGRALVAEHHLRYPASPTHGSSAIIEALARPPRAIENRQGLTPYAQAMPEQYRREDAVVAYRLYYLSEKSHMATWANCEPPYWVRSDWVKPKDQTLHLQRLKAA